MDLRGILDLFDKNSSIEEAVMASFETACKVLESIPESVLKSQFLKGCDEISVTNTLIVFQDYDDEGEGGSTEVSHAFAGINLEQIVPGVDSVTFLLREKEFALFWDEFKYENYTKLAEIIEEHFDGVIDNAVCSVCIPLSKLMK